MEDANVGITEQTLVELNEVSAVPGTKVQQVGKREPKKKKFTLFQLNIIQILQPI